MFKALPLAALIIPLALGACATQTASSTPPAGRDCFHGDSISGYNTIDDHHVSVTVGASRKYIFTTNWNARDLDWSQHIAIRSSDGWICTGNGLGVEIIGGQPRQTYPVNDIALAPPPPTQGS